MRTSSLLFFTSIAAITLATACSDDEEPAPPTSTGTTTTSSTSSTGGGDGGDGGAGGESTTTTGGMGGTPSTGGMGGTPSTGGAGGTGGSGGGETVIHGCTPSTAVDMTGQTTVSISGVSPWNFGHHACVLVDVGTTVTWTGDFATHPLVGGIASSVDPASPITAAGSVVMGQSNGTASATLAVPDEYPYFCSNHPTMQGVIYVQ